MDSPSSIVINFLHTVKIGVYETDNKSTAKWSFYIVNLKIINIGGAHFEYALFYYANCGNLLIDDYCNISADTIPIKKKNQCHTSRFW